jgi:Isocitrate/isopropylmalate dehydrogenase
VDPFCEEIGMNTRSNMVKVAVVGGEGIGPEVTAQSQRVLNWFATKRNLPMTLREAQYGIIPYLATGKVLPDDTVEAMEEADAILWGATGGPETKEVPPAARKAGSLLGLRSKYDLYANLRPIVANPALSDSAPLKAHVLKGVDFVIIRELTSGIYFGEPRGIETLPDGQRRGFNTEQYTTNQIRRVARSAFELARTRRNKVCSVDKANVLETSVVWREEVIRLHQEEFSDVELTHLYVDNRHADRARAGAIRRDGHRQYFWRYPFRLRGDGVGLARHVAVGLAGSGGPIRPAQGALRAGAWQRARHRGQRDRQSARLDPERRHDAADDAEPAGGCGSAGEGRRYRAGVGRADR